MVEAAVASCFVVVWTSRELCRAILGETVEEGDGRDGGTSERPGGGAQDLVPVSRSFLAFLLFGILFSLFPSQSHGQKPRIAYRAPAGANQQLGLNMA